LRGVRERDAVDQINTLNLQGPRSAKLDLNKLLKDACAKAVKQAQQAPSPDPKKPGAYEGPEVRALLDRIGQVFESNDQDYFTKNGTTRSAWVLNTAQDPWQTASVFKNFGRITRTPLFEDLATMIAGYQQSQAGIEHGEGRQQRMQRFAEPEQAVQAGTKDYGINRNAYQTRMAQESTVLEAFNQAGNAVDLVVPGKVVSFIANYGPDIAAATWAKVRGDAVHPGHAEFEHPELRPFIPLANSTMDVIEARESVARLENAQRRGEAIDRTALDSAKKREALAEQGVVEASKQVPQRKIEASKESAWNGIAETASKLGALPTLAMSPTAMPAISFLMEFTLTPNLANAQALKALESDTAMLGLQDPKLAGRVLLSEIDGIPAGTELTPEVVQKLSATHGTALIPTITPEGSRQLQAAYQANAPDAQKAGAAGVQAMFDIVGAHMVRGAMYDVASNMRVSRNTSPMLKSFVTAARTQLGRATAGQRVATWAGNKLAAKAGAVARFGAQAIGHLAQDVPGAARVGKALEQLSRIGKLPAAAASRAERLAALGRLGGVGARLATGGAVVSAGLAAREAILSGTEQGKYQHEQGLRDLAASDAETSWGRQVGRDLAAIPESLFWSTEHAKARLGEWMGSRGFGDPEYARIYREALDEARFNQDLGKQYEVALADVEKMMPGLSQTRYHELASEMALNRTGTARGLIPRQRQVSEYERAFLESPVGEALPPENKARAVQILREVGPEVFHNTFFYGDSIPDKPTWAALHHGLQAQVPDRLAEFNVSWRDPVEDRIAAQEAKVQQTRQVAQNAAETQEISAATQQARAETQQSAVQSQQRAQQSEADLAARSQQQAEQLARDKALTQQKLRAQESEQAAFMAALDSQQARSVRQDQAFAAKHPGPAQQPQLPELPQPAVAAVPGASVDSAPTGTDNPTTASKPARLDVTKYLPKTPAPI
jgi:hypothetical protein